MKKFLIESCHGMRFDLREGQSITVIDVSGGQVADFFAQRADVPDEYLSPAVTIDCNESLHVGAGTILYTNLYRPMLEVNADDVETHGLLFPSCSKAMYDFFY